MKKKCFIEFLVVFVLAVAFTALVKIVDVGVLEATGSKVGFASVNLPFATRFSFNSLFYTISEVLGILAILTMGVFGFFGILQLIKGKSLKKVDGDLYALAISYVLAFALYIFFDKVLVINLRPIFMSGEIILEPSFPSSHTLLAIVAFGGAVAECGKIEKKGVKNLVSVFLSLLMTATIVFRLFSGVHWVTDILGGVLWGETILLFFQYLCLLFEKKR